MKRNHKIAVDPIDRSGVATVPSATSGKMATVVNLTLFKLVWVLSIIGIVINWPWLGAIGLSGFLIWHGLKAPTAKIDFKLVLVAISLGIAMDTVLIYFGLIGYMEHTPSTATAAPTTATRTITQEYRALLCDPKMIVTAGVCRYGSTVLSR